MAFIIRPLLTDNSGIVSISMVKRPNSTVAIFLIIRVITDNSVVCFLIIVTSDKLVVFLCTNVIYPHQLPNRCCYLSWPCLSAKVRGDVGPLYVYYYYYILYVVCVV